MKYGQAQKIVNITFKHIYCFGGMEKYEQYFKFCHMALDRYVFAWFRNDILPWINNKIKEEKEYKNINLPQDFSWSSKFADRGDPNSPLTYLWFQDNIRKYIDESSLFTNANGECLTPFQVEFYIWPEIIIKLSIQGAINNIEKNINNKMSHCYYELLVEMINEAQNEISRTKSAIVNKISQKEMQL